MGILLRITDVNGREIHNQRIGSKSFTVQVKNFPSGIYFIHTFTGEIADTQYVIKK